MELLVFVLGLIVGIVGVVMGSSISFGICSIKDIVSMVYFGFD